MSQLKVALEAHHTRDGTLILRPATQFEYDLTALLKAKTLLAFYKKFRWIEVLDLELDDVVLISIGKKDGVSLAHTLPMGEFVSIALLMEKNPGIVATVVTKQYVQRFEQPGYAIVKKEYLGTFLDVFLKTSEEWLGKHPEVVAQLETLCK